MRIQKIYRQTLPVSIDGKVIAFDANGFADVDEAIGRKLLECSALFRCVDSPTKPVAQLGLGEIDLEQMSTAQLKKHAKDKGIEIGEASKKAELIELIRAAK